MPRLNHILGGQFKTIIARVDLPMLQLFLTSLEGGNMKLNRLFAVILAFASVTVQADAYVAQHTEYPLATTLASFSVGPDLKRYSVRVRNCAEAISSIMLSVTEAGLQVEGAGATYADGSTESYSLSYNFPAGYESPWISIDSFKEEGRCVKSVYVDAQSVDPRIKSRVKVLGN